MNKDYDDYNYDNLKNHIPPSYKDNSYKDSLSNQIDNYGKHQSTY